MNIDEAGCDAEASRIEFDRAALGNVTDSGDAVTANSDGSFERRRASPIDD